MDKCYMCEKEMPNITQKPIGVDVAPICFDCMLKMLNNMEKETQNDKG